MVWKDYKPSPIIEAWVDVIQDENDEFLEKPQECRL